MSVLDVGCGTGTQLALYQAAGCPVAGVDTSPAMLQAARHKLGGAADLRLEDATRMSFPDGAFDLVTAAFLFHVVPVAARPALLGECLRVLKGDGRLLAFDYHTGPLSFPLGWAWRWVATCIERMAGSEHYANYRSFLAQGGLPTLAAGHHLSISAPHTAAGGVLAIYVLSNPQRQALLSMAVRPGETLSENAWAQRLGISRTPVREALHRLEQEGLVGHAPRQGWFARTLSLDDIHHIFDIKVALEGMATRQAAGNPRLEQIIHALNSQWNRLRVGYLALEGRLDRTLGEHTRIAQAILAGDGPAAEEAMRSHLQDLRRSLVNVLESLVLPLVGPRL